ncbi:hypothetical protein CC86DRAFT_288307 [Ophiobolus disseminans]|uniref:BTB domain-containing protein n=1 Tax=Ophiobolus disseminans TaxID=1469910 RepID=A0A6A7A7R9_9PLEO|nr:hypothetical protein CC86DRAFT_288307 [Ophiobolus disseminans]
MDDLTFINDWAPGYGTLKAVYPNGQVDHISDCIEPHLLLDKCPLLYHVFEYGHPNRIQAEIEAPSRTAVIALLRYCYTGSYLPWDAEYAPILFMPHVELFKMAHDFDVPELQLLTHGNLSCQVSYACSLPNPPQDLLETIQYVYKHCARPQQQHDDLRNTLLNYCISVFQSNQLGDSAQFLQVVREIPEFRQDLCRTNMHRNFEDDCALEIVQLALDTLQPRCGRPPTTLASRDLPAEMLVGSPAAPYSVAAFDPVRDAVRSNESDNDSEGHSTLEDSAISFVPGSSTLVFRPKITQPVAATGFETDSSSEDEGFSIVHRPRPLPCATPDDPMSSPEIVPSNPQTLNVLAMIGSAYPDDDEWTML